MFGRRSHRVSTSLFSIQRLIPSRSLGNLSDRVIDSWRRDDIHNLWRYAGGKTRGFTIEPVYRRPENAVYEQHELKVEKLNALRHSPTWALICVLTRRILA